MYSRGHKKQIITYTVKRKLHALRLETRCLANNGYRWFLWALLQIIEILFQNGAIKNVVDERKI